MNSSRRYAVLVIARVSNEKVAANYTDSLFDRECRIKFLHPLAGGRNDDRDAHILRCIAYAHSQHRKRKIVDLTMQLRRLLQGDYRFDFGAFEEGELEVLSSDLGKLVISYREQADALYAIKCGSPIP